MQKCSFNQEDPYIALLMLRSTPQEGVKYSQVQRLMGRRTKTLLPTKPHLLKPEYAQDYQEIQEHKKSKIGERSNDSRELQPLKILDTVRMQPIEKNEEIWKPAKVTKQLSPRSYIVTTEDGKEFRRDRPFLKITQNTPPSSTTKKKENSDEETVPECSQDGKTELTTVIQTPPKTTQEKWRDHLIHQKRT